MGRPPVCPGTDGADTGCRQRIECLQDSVPSAIERMVVRERQHVDPRPRQRGGQVRTHLVGVVAGLPGGLARQGALEVPQDNGGVSEEREDGFERIVDAPASQGLPGVIAQHDVPDDDH